jgi:GNAT superfamily N-acetyltransferase
MANTALRFSVAKTPSQKKRAAEKALKAHLYVSGWTIEMWLKLWLKYDPDNQFVKRVVICSLNGNAVGLGIRLKGKFKEGWVNTVIYVKPAFRRRGIGTKIFQKLIKKDPTPVRVAPGLKGSSEFFQVLKNQAQRKNFVILKK